jgi:hypothetical protein
MKLIDRIIDRIMKVIDLLMLPYFVVSSIILLFDKHYFLLTIFIALAMTYAINGNILKELIEFNQELDK